MRQSLAMDSMKDELALLTNMMILAKLPRWDLAPKLMRSCTPRLSQASGKLRSLGCWKVKTGARPTIAYGNIAPREKCMLSIAKLWLFISTPMKISSFDVDQRKGRYTTMAIVVETNSTRYNPNTCLSVRAFMLML